VYVSDYGIVLGSKLYIKEVLPGGVAAQDGSLKEGDSIVRVCKVVAQKYVYVKTCNWI